MSKEVTAENAGRIERGSLRVAMAANLVMGMAGIYAALASRSDALLVDGLFSAVNFLSAIVAARVGISIARAPDRRRPFGYDADEAIYVTFRSMILAGLVGFAGFNSIQKILHYLSGGDVPELRFGVIVIYTIGMVAICAGLWGLHLYNWHRTGKRSEILKTEARAAFTDGLMSAGTGIALSVVPFLRGTALAPVIPIADALIVLILALIIVPKPIGLFLGAIGELAGHSVGGAPYRSVRIAAMELAKETDSELLEVALTKLGRSYFAVAYINSRQPMNGDSLDALNDRFTQACRRELGSARSEIILTARTLTTGRQRA